MLLSLLVKIRQGPFFLNLWYYDVHGPIQGKEELIEKYEAKIDPDDPHSSPVYAAMVETLDQNIGRDT